MIDRTDEETGELVRAWLQRYGLSIIIGIVLAIAMIGGYEWWQNKQTAALGDASAKLIAINDAIEADKVSEAEALYQQFDDEKLKPIAALLMASAYNRAENSEEELAHLALASKSDDGLVAQTANWQLAQVYIGQKDYAAAEKSLQALKGGAYEQQIPLMRAVIAQQQGDLQVALDNYKVARDANPDQAAFIDMQIAAVQGEIIVGSNTKEQ